MNTNSSYPPSPITILQQILDKLSILPIKVTANEIYGFVTSLLQHQAQSYDSSTSPAPHNIVSTNVGSYVSALDELRSKIFEFRELEEEYKKLEAVLQKNQTQIRKHIGIEQQFRLYIDTIKAQYQQSENQRLELLDNSKMMIKQLKLENQRLSDKLKDLEDGKAGGLSRCPDTEKKSLHAHKNKERIRSQYCSSLYINHNRHYTQNTFISPPKQRLKPQDFRIQLTDRIENSKKKKVTDIKKKQNYTVMAYMGHKKRQSKDKNHYKKALLSFSHKKKINLGSEIKGKQMSQKKVNKSAFSLQSIDYAKQQ